MDLERIKSLIDAMAASSLDEMEFSEGGWTLKLVRRSGGAAPVPEPARNVASSARRTNSRPAKAAARTIAPAAASSDILAPMFGVVYLRPAPDTPQFVMPGQKIVAGTLLCVVEAMKVFNEIRAPHDGMIETIAVASGQEVEAGQTLMRLQ